MVHHVSDIYVFDVQGRLGLLCVEQNPRTLLPRHHLRS